MALDRAFGGWATAWSVAPAATACSHGDASALEPGTCSWHPLARRAAWLGVSGDRRRAMRRLLAPDDRAPSLPPLAAAMAESAWSDLAARLVAAVGSPAVAGPDAPEPPDSDRRAWSGALVGLWGSTAADPLVLHLSEPAVAALVRRAGPAPSGGTALVSVREAIATQDTTVRIVLEPVHVDLGSLLCLVPGDVLPLPHPLDRPLALHLVDADGDVRERPIAGAQLGARGRRRAIAMTRHVPKETP